MATEGHAMDSPAQAEAIVSEERPPKRAIALIAHDRIDYFERVFASICQQQIAGKPVFERYDFYVFQDGLAQTDESLVLAHQAITDLVQNTPNVKQLIVQPNNLGVAKHFAFVEEFLFLSGNYDFVVFCEDDMVLGDAYMATLHAMADLFYDDERIAMVSAHSQAYKNSLADQAARAQEYLPMGHSWGFGLFRRAWLSIQPIVKVYLELLGDVPYQQRNHTVIQFWQQQCGFRVGASSQDYIKACALVALGYLRVSCFPNFGLYIGEKGLHFNEQVYAKYRYAESVMYETPVLECLPIDENLYQKLWEPMSIQCLNDPKNFNIATFRERVKNGLSRPVFPNNLLTPVSTAEDVIALDKLLLNRFPKSQQEIDDRIGLPMDQLFKSAIDHEEFIDRHQYWPAIIMLARKIMMEYEKEQHKQDQSGDNS